jgi:hypothetical protein
MGKILAMCREILDFILILAVLILLYRYGEPINNLISGRVLEMTYYHVFLKLDSLILRYEVRCDKGRR